MPHEEHGRRRRPLPGEGSNRLGTDFDQGLPGSGAPTEEIVYNVGGAGLGDLGQYTQELIAMAIEYRRNLEEGHIPMRYAVASYLALPSLRAFWPFTSIDESDVIKDLSAQGRDLTQNSTSVGSGGLGGHVPVISFGTAGSRYLSRADETGLNWDGLSSLTVLAWVNAGWTTEDFTYAPVVTKGDGNTGIEYGFHVRRNSRRVRVMAGSDSWLAPVALEEGQWNFVGAGVHSAGVVRAFVNGSSAQDSISPGTLAATTDPFYVGRYDDGGSTEYWQGSMALVAVAGTLLSSDAMDGVFEGTRRAFGV